MRIIIGNQYYSTPDPNNVTITRSMSDPVPTATVNLTDNTSAISIPRMSEILILDDQVYPNPTTNYLRNPNMNPDSSFWTIGAPTGVTTSQVTGGGINITTTNTVAGIHPITQQQTSASLLIIQPGQTFVCSAWVQGSAGNTNVQAYMAVQWFDVNLNFISSSTFSSPAPVPTSATRYSLQVSAPANAYFINVQLGINCTSSTNNGTVTFTQAQLEPLWIPTMTYPTPFCGPSQTNCQQLPNSLWIRQYRKFAGFVNHTVNQDYVGNKRTVVVDAVGYAWLASTIIGNDNFTNKTDAQIIEALLAKYFLNGSSALCTTTNIVTGTTLSNVQLNWDDMRTTFDNLCSQSGFYWTIDFYWNFVYAPPGYFSMPISLICDNSSTPDNVTTFPAYNFSAENDYTQPGSNILTIGGTSGGTTFTAQVIDPSVIEQIGITSGYMLPSTTSWMRKVTDNALQSNSDCTQRGMAEFIQYDNARNIYHLSTNVEILAGYGIAITSNTDGLNQSTQLIQQVQAQWLGTNELLQDEWEYQADLGAANRAATNMISRIFRNTTASSSAPAMSSLTLAVLEPIGIVDGQPGQGTIITNYAQTILADTPIAYYRLAELTGTIADDISGNANQGTIAGSPTLNVTTLLTDPADSTDKSITFASASSQNITLPTSMIPTGAHAWSLECWFKITAIPASGTHGTLMGWGASTGNQKFGVLNLASNGTACQLVCSTNNGDITSGNLSANTIYHAVGTYDGTSTRLYLNGALVAGPTAFTLSLTATMAQIASYTAYSNSFFSGTIDEVAFYNFALSATQISNHYAAGI